MRKFATIAAGTALAAGVVLVPAAGFASAATSHSAVAAKAPVTQVHPRDVWAGQCYDGGGIIASDWNSPSGYVCVGGWYDGEIVWW